MSGWFIFLIIFALIFLYLIMLIRNYTAKERASDNRMNAHFMMLGEGIDTLGKENSKRPDSNNPHFIPNFQKLWGHPPEKEKIIQDIIEAEQGGEGWDYAIHIHEGTKHYLGKDLFTSMEGRIASLPGIDKCLLEDKEVLYINSQSYPTEIMIELVWREFLHAAEIAHLKNNIAFK